MAQLAEWSLPILCICSLSPRWLNNEYLISSWKHLEIGDQCTVVHNSLVQSLVVAFSESYVVLKQSKLDRLCLKVSWVEFLLNSLEIDAVLKDESRLNQGRVWQVCCNKCKICYHSTLNHHEWAVLHPSLLRHVSDLADRVDVSGHQPHLTEQSGQQRRLAGADVAHNCDQISGLNLYKSCKLDDNFYSERYCVYFL